MVAEKKFDDVWLQKIPWMLHGEQLLVLVDCIWKLVVVVDLCCQLCGNDEFHYHLFLNLLKAGQT